MFKKILIANRGEIACRVIKTAKKMGIKTVAVYSDADKDALHVQMADEAVTIAREIGYPVMIKASAGGGGKGMRLAWNDQEAHEGFVSATNEAKASFADDRVFVEKFIEQPRHIEIQVLGDSFGNVVYLGERECSIQRRHQKVVEEAPSPFLTQAVREAMGRQAVALAKAVNYKSAGTVEFIVDGKRNFYFLEMNTRLQVEHPVTEMITGLDLVEWMIRIAAGERLPFSQADVKLDGWAIEARVYAEDPFRNFLPSTGRLTRYTPPAEGRNVRVDTGVTEGGEISMFYDPMIAKLIAYGPNRQAAIGHMRQALDEYYIRGLSHNIPFLASLMSKERFVVGALTTNFIAEEYPAGFRRDDLPAGDPTTLIAVAASVEFAQASRSSLISGQFSGHEVTVPEQWTVVMNGKYHDIVCRRAESGFAVVVAGEAVYVNTDWTIGQPLFRGTVDGRPVCVQVDRVGIGYRLSHDGLHVDALVLTRRTAELHRLMPVKAPPDMSKYLLSPMPGLLRSIEVSEGQEDKAGKPLAVVEAMKMENILKAERDGTIGKLHAKPGESLAVDQKIIEFAA